MTRPISDTDSAAAVDTADLLAVFPRRTSPSVTPGPPVSQAVGDVVSAVVPADRRLPAPPTAGQRDGKGPEYEGDTLVWKPRASAYAARLTVWPPNVAMHSDFQRDFKAVLNELNEQVLRLDGGSTGTRFVNRFQIKTRNADRAEVLLHSEGWSYTAEGAQELEWNVSAAEFNQLGTSVSTDYIEVWGEFRALYGGGIDELRGRTQPFVIGFGEEDDWPATRGDIPEQRVLQDVSVASAETRGKLVTFDDGRGYLTRPERDVTTAATATFENYSHADYLGAFGDANEPDAAANIGSWYWHRTRTTAFRSFRDDTFGAIWRAVDVNRIIIGGEYRGSWPADSFAVPHITQIGDYYSDAGGNLRVATAYTAEQHTHLRDGLDRIVTEAHALYSVAALQWDVNPSVLSARTAAAIATTYTINLAGPVPNLTGLFYRLLVGGTASSRRPWVHGLLVLPTLTMDATQAGNVLANLPAGQDHFEVLIEFFDAASGGARVGVTSRRIEFAGSGGEGGSFIPSKANLYPAIKAIFHPSTNAGVSADDDNSELDVSGGAGALTQAQQIGLIGFDLRPKVVEYKTGAQLNALRAADIYLEFSNPDLLTGDAWYEIKVPIEGGTPVSTNARQHWQAPASVELNLADASIVLGAYDTYIPFDVEFYDAANAGNLIERVRLTLSLVEIGVTKVTDRAANAFGVAALVSSDFADTIRLTGSVARTYTLPLIPTVVQTGWYVTFVNDSTAVMTVDGNGAQTIDGAQDLAVQPGEAVTVQVVSASAWSVISRKGPPVPANIPDAPAQGAVAKFYGLSVPPAPGPRVWGEFDPTSGGSSEADTTIGGALAGTGGSTWNSYTITEDIEGERWYRFLMQVGTSPGLVMPTSAFKGQDFLDLSATADGATFAQGIGNSILGVASPRPNADGVRTFFLARTATARRILVRSGDDAVHRIVRLDKLGGIRGPAGRFDPQLVFSGAADITNNAKSIDAGFEWPADAGYLLVAINPAGTGERGSEGGKVIRNPRFGRYLGDSTPVTSQNVGANIGATDSSAVGVTVITQPGSSAQAERYYFGRTSANRATLASDSTTTDPTPLVVMKL